MRVVIAGGHGQIALLLARVLADRGYDVLSLNRKPEQSGAIEAAGATPVVLDLETASRAAVAEALAGADAAVFAAGAGPGSTIERKYTVDKGGSVLLADACEEAGTSRFVQISSMGAGAPAAPGGDPVWAAYIDAKTQAEDDLKARGGLAWTIVRPGGLTNDAGTGTVTLAPPPLPRASVPRADVAGVIAELLNAPGTAGLTLELRSGPMPIRDAVAAVARAAG
ncbi:MAG: NAD(P)H-binding protein [Streptomycetaceae bacterium]|nr:NAD(P)H-binding protein [Streptomycetaceae bacterium]